MAKKVGILEAGKIAMECPACGAPHVVPVDGSRGWQWNGDFDKPTISPSILVTYNGPDAGVDGSPPSICHSFVRGGQWQYLGDCTHALKGQTVDIPDWDD